MVAYRERFDIIVDGKYVFKAVPHRYFQSCIDTILEKYGDLPEGEESA